jgi:hypothetical protein
MKGKRKGILAGRKLIGAGVAVVVVVICAAVAIFVFKGAPTSEEPTAEEVQHGWLLVGFTVNRDNTATISGVELLDNGVESFVAPDNYSVVLLDEENNSLFTKPFSVTFYIMSDPPVEIDNVPMSLVLPYNSLMKRVELRLDNQVLASRAIG